MTIPARIEEIYRNRTVCALFEKKAGKKVVGYFADDVPTALIEAAGFLPFRLFGDPDGGQPRSMPRGPKDVRSDMLEFVNSWIHLIANGYYDFIDYYVISNSRKYILQLAERMRALDNSPSFYILDRAMGLSDAAITYNRAEVTKLKNILEKWSGKLIESSALEQAVDRHNRRAAEMTRIASLRETTNPRLSGQDALRIMSVSRWMHSSAYLDLLQDVDGHDMPVGLRLFISGSGQDMDAVYAAVESDNAIVVGESHPWGARLLEEQINDGDPFDAVANHYARHADFVVPLSDWAERVAQRCRRSDAQALLNYVYAHDDGTLWEGPSEAKACNIPHKMLAEQPYHVQTEAVKTVVEDLSQAIVA